MLTSSDADAVVLCCCRQGFLALLFSLLSLLPMSAFLYMELCTIAAYGWGWLRAWNVLDMVSLPLTICTIKCTWRHTHLSCSMSFFSRATCSYPVSGYGVRRRLQT